MSVEQDGIDIVLWYQKMPDHGTWFTDRDIAYRLKWFRGGKDFPTLRRDNPSKSEILAQADVARVRKARRYVDRNTDLFDGYWFGTKRNGAGVKWSHLNSPELSSPDDATDAAAAEQFARLKQADQQFGVELERNIGKLEALKEEYTQKGKLDHAFVCHDAIRDLQTNRQISLGTVDQARKLGIPIPTGRAS